MGFGLVEDRPTPPEVYNWRVYAFATIAAAGCATFGYDNSFFGTTLARSSFQEHFGFNNMDTHTKTKQTANITSTFLAAAIFGAMFSWPSAEGIGRIRSMQLTAVIFTLGAVLMTATTSSLDMMYAGRALTGFGVGALTGIVPTYIAEVSPPAIRGMLTGYFEIAYQVGGLVGFWINYGISQNIDPTSVSSFRIPIAVQLIPSGILAVGTFFLRESPALLFRKGKDDEAMKNLCYVRQLPEDHQYILEEVGMIRARLDEERKLAGGQTGMLGFLKGALRELSTGSIRYRLIVTIGMFAFQNWSGAICISYYSPKLFTALGITDVNLYTGIYGIFKATGAIIFCGFIVDRTGRRKPWLLSASICSLCLLYLAIFTKIGNVSANAPAADKAAGRAGIAFVMLYAAFWSFGGNGLPWIVSAEIFPLALRPITGAISATSQWIFSYACTEIFPYMVASRMGVWGAFLFFSACCCATAIFTFFMVPETKAVPIECMEPLFDGPMRCRAWRAKALFPPTGVPPVPDWLAAGQLAYVEAHQTANSKGKVDVEEIA